MTATTVSAAIRSGMIRGTRLAMNPTVENFRQIRTKPVAASSTVQGAWADTGRSLRRAMEQEKRQQR